MTEQGQPRRVKVDWSSLEVAFASRDTTGRSYLDLETGEVPFISRELWSECDALADRAYAEEVDFETVVAGSGLSQWQQNAMPYTLRVIDGEGTQFLRVPDDESYRAFEDMEDFVATVQVPGFVEQASRALEGRRPFRRFRDVLGGYPEIRERWFAFQSTRLRKRIRDWLEEEGVEALD